MASDSPRLRERRQSIGMLKVTDTETMHHPVWSQKTDNPNENTPDLQRNKHGTISKTSTPPPPPSTMNNEAQELSTNQISPSPPTTLDPSINKDVNASDEIEHDFDIDYDGNNNSNNNNNNNNNNDAKNTNVKDRSNIQFRHQMSYISNLSELTLKMTCREKYLSWRYGVVLLLHFVFYTAIFMRNCMPIALVCMTDPSPKGHHQDDSSFFVSNGSSLDDADAVTQNDSFTEQYYEFHWDLNTQSLILSAIQFSSCVGPLLCDLLRVRIGSKHTLTVCTFVAAVLTILSPIGARISSWVLFTIRVLLGVFLGANVSTTADLLSWWAPASEKQTMTSFVFAGVNIGGMIVSLASGFLCSIPLDNGWPFIFYVFGALAIAITAVWHFLNANKPEEHRFISETECNFIMNYRTPIDTGPKGTPEKPPYKKIFTSVPVLSFLASSASQVWTTNLYFTVLPNFFVTVHKFTVEEAGIILSMVSLARFLGILVWTMIINRLRKAKISNTKTKKIILTAGYGSCAVVQLAILFLDYEHRWVAVGLFLVLLACQVSGMCIFTVLPMDMAPRYAGFLSGVFYSTGSLISITGPLMVAALAPNSTFEEWRMIWIIVSGVFVISVVIFLIFGDASVQPWARVRRDSRPNIQSAFVSMGRRISAVLDGPISSTSPAVRGSRDFSFQANSFPNGVSMAPSGSETSLSNHEVDGINGISGGTPSTQRRNYDYDSNNGPSSSAGVSNPGFVQEEEDEEGPGMIDKVTAPSTLACVEGTKDVDSLEQRWAQENLDYIDQSVDAEENDSQPQINITRL